MRLEQADFLEGRRSGLGTSIYSNPKLYTGCAFKINFAFFFMCGFVKFKKFLIPKLISPGCWKIKTYALLT